MQQRIFYFKANRKEWKDILNEKNDHLDWTLIQNNPDYEGGILFSARHKKRDYFEQVKPGDLAILHSTHISNSKKKSKQEFVPKPRIVGISKISEGLHYDDSYKDDEITVDVENMVIFDKPVEIKELDLRHESLLQNAEPFKLGTNRFTLTELKNSEYQILKERIINKNPNFKKEFEKIES